MGAVFRDGAGAQAPLRQQHAQFAGSAGQKVLLAPRMSPGAREAGRAPKGGQRHGRQGGLCARFRCRRFTDPHLGCCAVWKFQNEVGIVETGFMT